jgi:hypothetical protein
LHAVAIAIWHAADIPLFCIYIQVFLPDDPKKMTAEINQCGMVHRDTNPSGSCTDLGKKKCSKKQEQSAKTSEHEQAVQRCFAKNMKWHLRSFRPNKFVPKAYSRHAQQLHQSALRP